MIEVFRTGELDIGICVFQKKDFEAQAKRWNEIKGLPITKYYTQVIKGGVIIASYIPKKEE
jgi:hypothetical protein